MLRIAISLTSSTFRFSDREDEKPSIVVESTLVSPEVITVNSRGEREAGTILGTPQELDFRVENFTFQDMSAFESVEHEFFPGSCEPGEEFLELNASKPRVTRKLLSESDPLSDPINILKPGHTYRVTLRPQKIKCWVGGIGETLARRQIDPPPEGVEVCEPIQYEYPGNSELTLACEDELVLKVEA